MSTGDLKAPTVAISQAFERLGEAASRRALAWRRLAEAFYGPTDEWVVALLDGEVEPDLRLAIAWLDSDTELFDEPLAALARFVELSGPERLEAVRESLDVDYAGLFIGPAQTIPAQPYESVWMDVDVQSGQHVFGNASTAAVEAVYATYGLTRSPSHHDLSDHIATEQEFLCYLCEREAAAWSRGDLDEAKLLRTSEQEFLTGHLARFAPELCRAIQFALPQSLYSALAGYLLAFLTVESGTPYTKIVSSIWPARNS
jgi:TorA maturation chaperone TorD